MLEDNPDGELARLAVKSLEPQAWLQKTARQGKEKTKTYVHNASSFINKKLNSLKQVISGNGQLKQEK